MTIKYETVTSETGSVTIVKTETGSDIVTLIPVDEANSDYQVYLDRDKPKAALSTPIVSSDAE